MPHKMARQVGSLTLIYAFYAVYMHTYIHQITLVSVGCCVRGDQCDVTKICGWGDGDGCCDVQKTSVNMVSVAAEIQIGNRYFINTDQECYPTQWGV
jgi:hypothetical protein